MDRTTMQAIEEMSFNALPALATQTCDGWIARYAEGVTGRANSINAITPGATPVADIADLFAPLYTARGLPCRFRVTGLCPPDTTRVLEARGFRHVEDVATETAVISDGYRIDPAAVLTPHSDDVWRTAYSRAAGRFDAHERAVLARMHEVILPAKVFAHIVVDGEIAALGFAVAERGWVSLHEIATAPHRRGAGLARRLVTSLMAWAHAEHGATRAWLQVTTTNAPARALYRSLGFSPGYEYAYWVAP